MESARRNPRAQGDKGELSAAVWCIEHGATVFLPFFHTDPHVDLVATWDHRVERFQVKTSTFFSRRRWVAAICTRGGNRSWSGLVKRLDPNRYDQLFVHVGDGRRWMIPSAEVDAGNTICLGGPKYADFEIEPGDPL